MITGIVAVCRNQGIGLNGQMPWPYLKDDMNFFKTTTLNHVIIMGSKTWYSLPKRPLPNRVNIVISRTIPESNGVFRSIPEAIDSCKINYPDKNIFIIGGQEIYDSSMQYMENIFVTEIDNEYECDKFFNYTWIKQNFSQVKLISEHTTPIKYRILEYKNDK